MTKFYSITGTVAFVTLMGSTAAFAEVTASEVWENWRGYMSSMGQTITGDESMSGTDVVVSNMTVTASQVEDQPLVSMNYGTITFKDNGDGTVAIQLPDQMDMSISKDDEFKMNILAKLSGQMITASGSANDIVYDTKMDEINISLAGLTAKGDVISAEDANAFIIVKDLSGSTRNSVGDMRSVVSTVRVGSLEYQINVASPKREGDKFALVGGMQSLTMNASNTMPLMMDMQAFPAMLAQGLDMSGDFSWLNGGMRFSLTDKGKFTEVTSESTGGSLNFGMTGDTFAYGMGATGVNTNVMTPDLPFPVDYKIGEFKLDFAMPIRKTDTPADFSALIKLVDFNTNDMIWSMGDPTGALPHDDATLIVDLAGKAQWLIDIMDPESAADVDMPGILHALTLKALQMKIAGADLTGAGAFTFDNADMATFPGFPRPDGALDLKLVGGNGLLDRLIQMGLVQEDQAMGARMMMGLFAQPGEGEDTLTSKIEVKDGGQVYANGQRLK